MSVNTSRIFLHFHTQQQDLMHFCILNHNWLNINFGFYHKLQHFPCSIIQSVVLMTCTAQRLTKLYFNSSMCDKKTNMQWNSRLFRQPIVVFAHFSTFFFTHMTIQKPNLSLWNKSCCILRYSFSSSA